ncbi:MAG TPA: FAD-binding oxidoreductase [Thermoleophilaceae bacterium]|nr:FAD-binding oxidoreductase [Thermoleophilaceae bacterium]
MTHVVVGAGVNGLSVAWALAERGADVVVLDKGRAGGGASGIAGGIVRNFYRSEPIAELVRISVEMFEEDPEAYGFRQVGYIAAVPEAQVDDLVAIRAHHERAGYDSELVTGSEKCREYLTWTWPDWEAPAEALLHERRSGWADAMQTVRRLAERARAAGVEIREGVEVIGFDRDAAAVRAVTTSAGRVECEALVLAPGPWAGRLLAMLGHDAQLEYLKAQEGEFTLRGVGLSGRAGSEAPVVHLDQAGPLRSDRDGRVLVDGPWGIYFRMGRTGTGITGGGLPVLLDEPTLDPYGPNDNPGHGAEPNFEEFFTSGLATALRRFRGKNAWRLSAAGGIVAHTRDNYPVCDWILDNTYAIVDSGHGFKTLAIGRLAAEDIAGGGEPLLDPFRLDRFERGELHTASSGPYPWT